MELRLLRSSADALLADCAAAFITALVEKGEEAAAVDDGSVLASSACFAARVEAESVAP